MDADTDFDDFTPWTPDGADRLRAAAADLAAALSDHTQTVAAASDDDIADVFEANDRLLASAIAYADAQFDYTGNFGPFGGLDPVEDDGLGDLDRLEHVDVAAAGATSGFSVLERRDYLVTDEAAVLDAGRRAYRRASPDDDGSTAVAEVSHLGRALDQIARADGWHTLAGVDGLRARAGYVAVIQHDDLLTGDPDQWPQDLSISEGELLHDQRDVY